MAEILYFFIAVIGLTHIMVDGKIMGWFRNLAIKKLPENISSMVGCYQCMGFWCGIICCLIVFWPGINSLYWFHAILYTIAGGWAGSFLASWGAIYFNYLEAKSVIELSNDEKDDKQEELIKLLKEIKDSPDKKLSDEEMKNVQTLL